MFPGSDSKSTYENFMSSRQFSAGTSLWANIPEGSCFILIYVLDDTALLTLNVQFQVGTLLYINLI